MDVLDDMSDSQINLASETARETVSSLISAALKTKGSYIVFTDSEIEEKKARETWVCSICGENTFDVDYEYIGSCTNHLGCELEVEMREKNHEDKVFNQAAFGDNKDLYEAKIERGKDRRKGNRREKNWLQKKHEDKVFGKPGKWREDIQGQIKSRGVIKPKKRVKKKFYEDMGDGHMLEVGKLAEEIVDNQNEKWIYESPDGGNTVFRRPFGDYDMKNKEEIDFKTKEPTGRMFTDYPFKEIQIDGC